MIKPFLFSVFLVSLFGGANAVTPWWEQTTVCKISSSNCYPNMTLGYHFDIYDSTSWDDISNCWGKKKICPEALQNSNASEPVALRITDINGTTINTTDFDVSVLNGECFGARKTQDDGAKVFVNGVLVKVWCNDILSNPSDEYIENGQIVRSGTDEPSCTYLANRNYAGIKDGKCYGKYYDEEAYAIQCDNDEPVLIILNGATREPNSITEEEASNLFNTMYGVAQSQHQSHFNH